MNKSFALLTLFFLQTHLAYTDNQSLQNYENQDHIVINNKTFVPYISETLIKNRIKEIGAQITHDYTGKTPVFVGVLNGSVIILSDVIREVALDCEMDFLKISSYGNSTKSSGTITLEKKLTTSIAGRDVIIIEDIIDSGLSITFVRNLLMQSNPNSIKIFSLLFKPETAKINFPIDYVGFEVPSNFLIGYGIDYAQKGRNLKSIYMLAHE